MNRADILKVAVLNKYGGVWLDASSILFKPIDESCYKEFETNKNLMMCGYFHPERIRRFINFDF